MSLSNDGGVVDADVGSHQSHAGASTGRALAVCAAAGVLGGIQPKINSVLGERVHSAEVASLVNFSAAFVAVCVVVAVRAGTRRRLRLVRTWPVPRWTFSAGLGGVAIVLAGAAAVGTIGVAIFSVAFFGGQIAASLVVDRFGIGSGGSRALVPARVVAAGLAVFGVVVSQIGRPVGELAPAMVAFVVVAGAASAFQAAFNARIGRAVGDAFAATAVNVMVGLAAITLIVAALVAARQLTTVRWPTEPWLYAGGLLGVLIVLALAVSSATLGVLRATLAMLAAQLATAFAVDAIIDHEPPRPGVIVGSMLIVVAVIAVGRHSDPYRRTTGSSPIP